jgi:hypothetical protein
MALSKIQHEHVASFLSFRHKSIIYAKALDNLALAFRRVGDHQKQKEQLERKLTIQERVYGPEHVAGAVTLSYLGTTF